MKRICYIVIILLLASATTQAQIKVEENADSKEIANGVIVHADPRLAILEKKHHNVHVGSIRSGRGFRVQIYNGNDRTIATETKIDFMRRFPGVRTYMTYVQPQFRVKVGDFRTRAEAEKLYDQVSTLYSPSMIVPDIIVINTLKDD
ncbi:SPOR domain-containing protein [Polluticoccus soli]|uniref:SPOR domain-containing protein n=1 Tax=Polluticoccus soli TaxID=3034150 RepID=UPI0023E1C599|nr:SPOR domain-containing protein [Flavipsychrobacter sp. JY13-12]